MASKFHQTPSKVQSLGSQRIRYCCCGCTLVATRTTAHGEELLHPNAFVKLLIWPKHRKVTTHSLSGVSQEGGVTPTGGGGFGKMTRS